MSIYQASGVCGQVPGELTPELYRTWGQALGRRVDSKEKFIIGGDVRLSTPVFLDAMAEGLSWAGVDVVDLGQLPLPMIQYAVRRLRAAGSAVVTGSGSAADHNGLKWIFSAPTAADADSAWLKSESQRVEDAEPTDIAAVDQRCAGRTPRPLGKRRALDVSFDYVAWLQETWVDARSADLHIVLDPMHGCWASRARRYLQAVFPRVVFSALHDTADGTFGGGRPDCSLSENLDQLADAVDRERADLGFAFDGDGDRMALVDNDGVLLTPEETACVFLESLGPGLHDETAICDVRLSDQVADAVAHHGGNALAGPSAARGLYAAMASSGAIFAASGRGHYLFRAAGGVPDGLFAACWMIDFLARSGASLASLRQLMPASYTTPSLVVPMERQGRARVLDDVRAAWPDHPAETVDGVRVHFADGWALVQESEGDEGLYVRFQGVDSDSLFRVASRFCRALPQLSDPLWARMEESMGGQCLLE